MKYAWLLLVALAFAGCSKDDSSVQQPDGPLGSDGSDSARDHQLGGYIVDPTVTPIAGVHVQIAGEGVNASSNDDGYYGFQGLPLDRALVIIATADGFMPVSKSLTLVADARHVLNFTMERVPVKTASMEKLSFQGFIGCDALVRTEGQRSPFDCRSVSAQDERVWEFTVKPDVAGVVIEASWEPGSELASHLNMTVETVDFGEFDEVLSWAEGEPILRGQVTKEQSERFYRPGGTIRVTMNAGRNVESEEMGAGAAVAFQQGYEVIASVFYVAGPPSGYTGV